MLQYTKFVSRQEAEELEPVSGWAVISITESDWANLKDGWDSVLRIQFHDIEPGWEQKYPDHPNLVLFNDYHARKIYEFVENVAETHHGILVHCKAGISRSAAVSRWIAVQYGLDYNEKYSLYNKHVFRILGMYPYGYQYEVEENDE